MRGISILKQTMPMIYSASLKLSERPGLRGLCYRKTEQAHLYIPGLSTQPIIYIFVQTVFHIFTKTHKLTHSNTHANTNSTEIINEQECMKRPQWWRMRRMGTMKS